MLQKIKAWWNGRKAVKEMIDNFGEEQQPTYTREQVENAYLLGYNDGKRDGLSLARHQATKSLKEILEWQNKTK